MKGIKTRVKNLTLASGLPTVSLGPEALRASVPPQGVTAVLCGGIRSTLRRYLNKGKRKLAPAIPARKWNQQVGSAPLASFGNKEAEPER